MKVALGSTTLWMFFVPFGGLPLWSWAFSLYPNPSLPMLGMISSGALAASGRRAGVQTGRLARDVDFRRGRRHGPVSASPPVSERSTSLLLGMGSHEQAVWSLAGLAVVLLAWGNRLGVLFLAALIAFQLDTLESKNCWDCVIDPFYWLISLGLGGEACAQMDAAFGLAWCRSRRRAKTLARLGT